MAKRRENSLKYKLLLLFASTIDEATDVVDIFLNPYRHFLGTPLYKRQTLANTISSLAKTGYIERKVKEDGEVVYRLTTQGEIKLVREIPLARFKSKGWDGRWRAVIFDIPENQKATREKLRHKLKELGFGQLQKSIWITPFDFVQEMEEFLKFYGLSDYALLMESTHLGGEGGKELAQRVWKLDDLHGKYLDFLGKWQELVIKGNELLAKQEEWRQEYFALLAADPGLPPELLPSYWQAEVAKKLFWELEEEAKKQTKKIKKRKI
jgi:phenylacetic acid degradation operon negative regulatory protein